MIKTARTAFAVSALLAFTVAAAVSRPITLKFKLPSKTPPLHPTLATGLTAAPVKLGLTDARKVDDPAIVGAQKEKGQDLYVWRAQQPVGPAVSGFVAQMLGGWSIRTDPEGGSVLAIELERYWVAETSQMIGSSYAAEVRLVASLTDAGGAVLWRREGSGAAKDSGPDQRASICNELLSLALREALAQALATPAAGEPVAPAPAAAPAAPAPLVIEPAQLLADLVHLKEGGVTDDVLVGYVKQRRLSRPLGVDDILAWKNAGIPDAAIKAAVSE